MSVIINVDKKVLLYRIRRAMPILGLAGASLLPCACSKDKEPVNPEKPATPVDTVDNRYDVTVEWSRETYVEKVSPTIASASINPDVRYIILQTKDSYDWGGGVDVNRILTIYVRPMIATAALAPEKVKHRGDIYRPLIRNSSSAEYLYQREDSATLCSLGYRILSPIYYISR